MRLFVTGIGLVSSLGIGTELTWNAVVAGHRGISPLSLFSMPEARAQVACEVRGVTPRGGWSRADAFALEAAREALGESAPSAGLIVGGTQGGLFESELQLAEAGRFPGNASPFPEARMMPTSATADRLREALPNLGPCRTVCSACSSGASAILLACEWILSGRAERVLAGATEGLSRLVFSGFNALAALDPGPCRPFDAQRAGLNLGEGAAFLLIESDASARRRGARAVCELRGGAMGAEAHHIANPEEGGATATRIMREAMARAGVAPKQIDYVHAHGTATPLNDRMEAAALRSCFGGDVERVPVSSSKGQLGHTLGAAGAFGAAFAALSIERGMLPPTAGLESPAAECNLLHVREATQSHVRATMTNAFGFGGTDVTLIATEPELLAPLPSTTRALAITGFGFSSPSRPSTRSLDRDRTRRMDPSTREATRAMGDALERAAVLHEPRTGVVLGGAYGTPDAAAAFVMRLVDRGARFTSPLEFPNLLPSSAGSHVSIYAGLSGPSLSVSDLSTSGEAALATAAELLEAGHADQLVAGASAHASPLVDRVLAPMSEGTPITLHHGEGAAAVVLEALSAAKSRGARILAHLEAWGTWSPDDLTAPWLPLPPGRRIVISEVHGGVRLKWFEQSAWALAERLPSSGVTDPHAAAGAFALATATEHLANGHADVALVLGGSPRGGFAFVLVR